MDEKAPQEADLDAILDVLREQGPNTACVFNCQMGKGRTTTGMILACLVKGNVFNSFTSNMLEDNNHYLFAIVTFFSKATTLILDIVHGDSSKKYYVDDTVGPDFGDDDEIAEEVNCHQVQMCN